jgi:hypothetical protein
VKARKGCAFWIKEIMGFSNFILVNFCLLLTVEARPEGWAREPRHQLGPGNKSRVGSFIQFLFLFYFLSPKASQLQLEPVGFKKFFFFLKDFFGLSPHILGVASKPGVAVDREPGVGGRLASFFLNLNIFLVPHCSCSCQQGPGIVMGWGWARLVGVWLFVFFNFF